MQAMVLNRDKLDEMIALKPKILDMAAHSGTKESETSKANNKGCRRLNM